MSKRVVLIIVSKVYESVEKRTLAKIVYWARTALDRALEEGRHLVAAEIFRTV
jgi:hypothetical protein